MTVGETAPAPGFAVDTLAGRTALVTGAAAGIGRATALALAHLGAAVAAVDLDESGVAATTTSIRELGGRSEHFVVDLEGIDRLDDLLTSVDTVLGGPSILINNAGVVGRPLLETDLDGWRRVIDVNLTAPFRLIRLVGERIAERGTGGSIVNVSSSSAFRAVSTSGPYAVSKAGLGALTRAAAWELGPYDVNVNAVAPGLTRTAIVASAFDDDALDQAVRAGPLANLLGRVSEPEDVANVITFLCLPASRQVTGQVIHTSAGAVVAAG